MREDVIALYGFATSLEQELFERLISISGIGPKLALAVLSGIETPDLVRAIRAQDVARLTAIPGVGKKTAERIGLELKDRLPQSLQAAADTAKPPLPEDQLRADLLSALLNLGYPRAAAEKAIEKEMNAAPERSVRSGAARGAKSVDEMSDRHILAPSRVDDDVQYEAGLRPRTLDEYIGQERIRENLHVAITAARQRGEALDHVLLYGPPGLGKTTLATVIANELGVAIRPTAGPVIERPGDLAAMLTNLQEREVLFIDEIHRMPPAIEEILYPAMEDYELDIMIGQGPGARSVKVPVQRFTLIGATTQNRAC